LINYNENINNSSSKKKGNNDLLSLKPTKDPNTCRAHVSIYAMKLGMPRVKVTEDIANVSVC
jgi:hypothetical protein